MSETKEIMKRLLESEVKAELLILFHKNPGLIDTPDGIARRIGRMGKQIEKDLRDFVELGLLTEKDTGGLKVISLNHEKDKEIQELAIKHVQGIRKEK